MPSYTTILSLLVPFSTPCVHYVNVPPTHRKPQTTRGHLGKAEVSSDFVHLGWEIHATSSQASLGAKMLRGVAHKVSSLRNKHQIL